MFFPTSLSSTLPGGRVGDFGLSASLMEDWLCCSRKMINCTKSQDLKFNRGCSTVRPRVPRSVT